MKSLTEILFDDWHENCPFYKPTFQERLPAECGNQQNRLCVQANCPFVFWLGAYNFEKEN